MDSFPTKLIINYELYTLIDYKIRSISLLLDIYIFQVLNPGEIGLI